MKNVSSLKSINTNSPKTPGGISKSLLTPCRRLGLSRNWRKSGPSPFVSPLSSSSQVTPVVKEDKKETRKRKERVADENGDEKTETTNDCDDENYCEIIDKTPSRNVDLPRRKKSKTLISTINKSQENIAADEEINETSNKGEMAEQLPSVGVHNSVNIEQVTTPVRSRSKVSKKHTTSVKSTSKGKNTDTTPMLDSNENATDTKESLIESKANNIINKEIESAPSLEETSHEEEPIYTIKEKSPNDLQKECVVVIQRKIFKNIESNKNTDSKKSKSNIEKPPQSDSDSDEAPLINLQKQNSIKTNISSIIDDDNDFIDSKTTNKVKESKINQVKNRKSPKSKLKTNKTSKIKAEKVITEPKLTSQNCFDDDDEDDDFDHKKTILIRKSYDKVSKPIKAKSTGSITQRDIDNLRERIEAKKKLLLAQSLTPETEELRSLIKKWQKGCQEALMELLDLMRNKCPDKERMDYSDMLKALKIPSSLVGYDSDNDCFNSPDDASVILGPLKDL